jgi:hypothetical protein
MNDSSPSISSAFAKRGEAVEPGLQTLLHVLLKNQSKRGLKPTDTLVLMNLTTERCSQRPFPRSTTIAGVAVRFSARSRR